MGNSFVLTLALQVCRYLYTVGVPIKTRVFFWCLRRLNWQHRLDWHYNYDWEEFYLYCVEGWNQYPVVGTWDLVGSNWTILVFEFSDWDIANMLHIVPASARRELSRQSLCCRSFDFTEGTYIVLPWTECCENYTLLAVKSAKKFLMKCRSTYIGAVDKFDSIFIQASALQRSTLCLHTLAEFSGWCLKSERINWLRNYEFFCLDRRFAAWM